MIFLSSLHIQRSNCGDVSLDHFLASLHLRKELRITNDAGRILNLSTRLVQSRNNPNNCTLKDIRQICDVLETHTSCPLIHYLHESESRPRYKVVGIIGGENDLVVCLSLIDLLGNFDYGLHASLEIAGKVGDHVCFLLEDEGRE